MPTARIRVLAGAQRASASATRHSSRDRDVVGQRFSRIAITWSVDAELAVGAIVHMHPAFAERGKTAPQLAKGRAAVGDSERPATSALQASAETLSE